MAKLNFACTGETVFRHVAHKEIISRLFPCRAIMMINAVTYTFVTSEQYTCYRRTGIFTEKRYN